ncbi:MAG: hypothetical protein U0Y10_26780 [Spirosomataceae bacterium]
MSQSDKEFEESWRKAFEEASVPPSERVWKGVEAHLDSTTPTPLRKSRWPYASVVLLLLLFVSAWLGWRVINLAKSPQGSSVATLLPTTKQATTATGTEQSAIAPNEAKHTTNETPLLIEQAPTSTEPSVLEKRLFTIHEAEETTIQQKAVATLEKRKKTKLYQLSDTPNESSEKEIVTKQIIAKVSNISTSNMDKSGELSTKEVAKTNQRVRDYEKVVISETHSTSDQSSESTISKTNNANSGTSTLPVPLLAESKQINTWQAALLRNKPFSNLVTWNPPANVQYQPMPIKRQSAKHVSWWLGANVMLNVFNPNAQIDDIAITAVTAVNSLSGFNAQQGQRPYSLSQSGKSYLVGFQGGVALSKHFFIEGGVQYWQGNSWLESDALFVNRLDSKRASLYGSLLANDQVISIFSYQNVLLPTSATYRIQNKYYYLSVPVRVGYRVKVLPKVETALSVGASSDFFLRNTILDQSSISLNAYEYTTKDQWYKKQTWSGVVGASINYDVIKNYKLSLDLMYRKSLADGVTQPSAVHTHLEQIGIGVGLKRQF